MIAVDYNPKEMLSVADAFQSVADGALKRILDNPHPSDSEVAPYVANAALALELYLKTILQIKGIAYPGVHTLSSLYALIPPDHRNSISRYATKAESRRPIPSNWKAKYPQLLTVNGCLEFSQDAFRRFRYIYEDEGEVEAGNLGRMAPHGFVGLHITEACRKLIVEIKPTLA